MKTFKSAKSALIWVGLVAMLLTSNGLLQSVEAGSTDPYGPKARRFGAGIILGDPTGISLKGYVSSRIAIDGIFSWSFVDDAFILIGDLTYDILDIPVNASSFTLPFYIGAGAKVGFVQRGNRDGKTLIGVRVPVGVGMQFINHAVEVFFEVAPGFEVSPATDFDITGGIGVRYYFF